MIKYRRNGKVKNVVLAYMNHEKAKFGQTIKGLRVIAYSWSLKYLEEKGAEPTSQRQSIERLSKQGGGAVVVVVMGALWCVLEGETLRDNKAAHLS